MLHTGLAAWCNFRMFAIAFFGHIGWHTTAPTYTVFAIDDGVRARSNRGHQPADTVFFFCSVRAFIRNHLFIVL